MLIVSLLPWRNHQLNWSRIRTRIYYNKRLQVLFFVFKQFLIGLKQNLWEEDNLSTRDKWPVPKVSSVRRFYCSKTPNNGPSEKRTSSLQRTAHLPPIDFTIEVIHFEPPRTGHLSTPNNGHWSGPDVPWSIQNYLRNRTVKLHPHNADACRPLS